MPPRVLLDKCNGCKGLEEAKCEESCPGDLMAVNEDAMKAYCRNTHDCWDCMSCIKACPMNALEIRIPYQIGYHKATLKPFMTSNMITWKCVDINGEESTYKYRNRMDR